MALTIEVGPNDAERVGTSVVVNDTDRTLTVTLTMGDGRTEIRIARPAD